MRRLSSGAPANCTAVEYCTHSPADTGWMMKTWISAMNRFGKTITCGRALDQDLLGAASP